MREENKIGPLDIAKHQQCQQKGYQAQSYGQMNSVRSVATDLLAHLGQMAVPVLVATLHPQWMPVQWYSPPKLPE